MSFVRAIVVGLLWSLLACAFGSPPLDAVVILDESGSMYGTSGPAQDPEFLRLAAVQCLARKMRPGDRIAVVPFGTKALEGAIIPFSDPFAAKPIDWSPLAARAKEGAAKSDSTNYADALRAATTMLGRPDPARSRIAILLSDGDPNAEGNEPWKIDREVSRLRYETGASLYTLGLGANLKTDLLEGIAKIGGGRSFKAEEPEKLPFDFADIFREAAGREVRTPPHQSRFVVGPNAHELRAIAVSEGGKAPFALIAPDGSRVEPIEEPAVYPQGQKDRVRWLRIPNPAAGEWRVEGDPGSLDLAYESSLRARLDTPRNGDGIPNSGEMEVQTMAEGTAPGDRLRGTATLEIENGRKIEADLRFAGERGTATLELDEEAIGRASLTIRIWRELADGTEEGVPATVELAVIRAKPGVPTVALEWPRETTLRVGANDRAKVALVYRATKEAVGKTLVLESNPGWRVEGGQITVAGRNGAVGLTIRGPYEGARGEFRLPVAARAEDPTVQVENGSATLLIVATNMVDVLLGLLKIGLPIFAALLFFLAFLACISVWWRLRKVLRIKALDSITVDEGSGNIVVPNRPTRSIHKRTFGDKKQDALLNFDPILEGRLLEATIAAKTGTPREMLFAATGMRVPSQPEAMGKAVIGSDTSTQLDIDDPKGDTRHLTVRFHYDAHLAQRIALLKTSMIAFSILLCLAVATSVWKHARQLDEETYQRESGKNP